MARAFTLGGRETIFIGEDKNLTFEVLNGPNHPTAPNAPRDIDGFTLSLVVAASDTASAIITVSGTVSGTYNAVRASNTQRVTFALTDTGHLTGSNFTAGTIYRWSVKRTDAGSETILGRGNWVVQDSTQD